MVTVPKSFESSSSFLTANWMCLGTILVFLLSRAAFPASSKTSAARYSRTAARYTGAPAPTLSAYFPALRNRAILPTGNWSPALLLLDVAFFDAPDPIAFPLPAIDNLDLEFEGSLGLGFRKRTQNEKTTESDIEMVFKKVGEVVEVKLAKDPYSSTKNKGFAFVRFGTVEQARRAVTELKQTVVKGKPCGVIRNKKSLTLHIGNICTSWRKDDLVEYLKAFNLENLEHVHLIDDLRNIGKNRGYAFLDFSTHMDAVAACSKLRRTTVFFGTDVRADIAMSKTIGSDDVVMEQVKSVFLDGFPVNWDETQLREHLKKFGEIESVQLARDMHTAKRKDFGFVSFTTREAALDCIEKVNKYGIGDGDDKILVKATLKRPFQKRTPTTLGVRGGYIGKGRGSRGKQPYGFSRSFRGRPSSPYEPMGRGFGERYRAQGRLSSRGRGARFRAEMSTEPCRSRGTGFRAAISSRGRGAGFREAMANTSRKFGSRFQRGSSMEIPAVPSRSRDPYYEDSSSDQLAPGKRHFYSTSYSQLTRPYIDDGYDSRRVEDYDYYDLPEYEYDDMPGYEHSYSELDHDMPMPVSRSQPQRGRDRRSSLEMAPNYQEYDYPAYDDEFSRFSPDEQPGYARAEYARRGRGYPIPRKYYAGRGTSKSYI